MLTLMGRNRKPAEPDGPLAETQGRFWRHALDGGWELLAGKTDLDNELLTFRVASATDYWFNARGLPGSHVVLRHAEHSDAGRDVLEIAAAAAAWYSKARGGGTVAVTCTRARHVKKPRGAKRGTVRVRRERILKVKPCLPSSCLIAQR